MALTEIRKNEKEEDKWMFDPNSERIRKKQRIKERIKQVLLFCSRMHISSHEVGLKLGKNLSRNNNFACIQIGQLSFHAEQRAVSE